MSEDIYPEPYEDDLEEHERNELAKDRELEDADEGCGCGDCDSCEARELSQFADPGGNSSLRAESATNPRNLPCPSCRKPNRLTPADKDRGYQCDECADRAEGGGYGSGEY
jgi:hypothetical protein